MKITKITYGKTIESSVLGAGVWIKISVDAEISELDNVAESIDKAKEVVDTAHQKEQVGRQPQGDIYFNVSKQKQEH